MVAARNDGGRRDRNGKVLLGTFVDPSVRRALKVIAATEGVTIGSLMDEAVAALLKERRPKLSELSVNSDLRVSSSDEALDK